MSNHAWDLDAISFIIPSAAIQQHILTTYIPHTIQFTDQPYWHPTSDCHFSVSSTYALLLQQYLSTHNSTFAHILHLATTNI